MLHDELYIYNMITLQVIEFCRSSEDISCDYDYLSDIDKSKLSNIDFISDFDFEDENQNYTLYLLITLNEIEKYKKLLNDNLIPYICTEISQDVIKNNINLERILHIYVDFINEERYYNFIKDVSKWIEDNLDIDIILDMISENGIKSLRSIDKEFLSRINE